MPNYSDNSPLIAAIKATKHLRTQNAEPHIGDSEWYGPHLEHAMRSKANRPFQVGFMMPDKWGEASLSCLLETWSLVGPHRCVGTEPDIPLFLETWERVPSYLHLGKELRRVCGDPHLFGYVSKCLGSRRVSTFMLNRAAWGYLLKASEKTLRGEKTNVPFDAARHVAALENKFDLRFGDGVKFSVRNGRFTTGELIFARGWRDMLPAQAQ